MALAAADSTQEVLPLVEPGTWEIDAERSLVAFEVRHLKLAKARGHFQSFEGRIARRPDGAAEIAGRVAIASIDSGDGRRDTRMRSPDFFDAERFPHMTFDGVGYGNEVRGRLTIKGTARDVVLSASRERAGEAGLTRLHAEGTISRRDFGLDWDPAFAAGGLMLDDRVRIRLDVVARRLTS